MSKAPYIVTTLAQRASSQKDPSATFGKRLHLQRGGPLVLPAFVTTRADPKPGEFLRDYWSATEAGNWETDVATGANHARDAIRFIREERAPHVLNWIASEMMAKRHFGPVEVGFFHEIGALIVRTRR